MPAVLKPGLLSLPMELLVDILSFLDFWTLLRCQAVSRRLGHVVHTSASLQYAIELGVAGYVDGPSNHPFNTFQRLNYLKARQDEWKNPELETIKTISFSSSCVQWEFRAGIFMRAVNTSRFGLAGFDTVQLFRLKPTAEDLPEQTISLNSPFNCIEFDPGCSQDLLIVFDGYPPIPYEFVEISLLSLRTGLPHPSANNPILRIPFVCALGGMGNVGIKIWDEIIVLHLIDGQVKVHFIHWRSGRTVATLTGCNLALRVTSLCRLSASRFAVLTYDYDSDPQMFLLDVFELNLSHNDGDLPRTPVHLATFQFPRMAFVRPPFATVISSFPSSSPPLLEDEYPKPSVASPSSGLICIRILSRAALPAIACRVFVLPTLFLTVDANHDGTPSVHPWCSWGPPVTRWIKDGAGHPALGIKPYAYRMGFLGRILDFNPLDIARDLCRQRNTTRQSSHSLLQDREQNTLYDNDPPPSRIVTQETIIFSDDHFRENVISSLPYRETLYEIPEEIQPSTICFVEEDLYCIELNDLLSPRVLHICSI